jgi:hypothetical protein
MIRIKISEEILVDFFLSEQSAEERVLKNNLNNCLNSIKREVTMDVTRQIFIVILTILTFVVGCSRNAEIRGIVKDPCTEKGIEGVEVWAVSDKLGKKVVAKTNKTGNYKLSLPPSEWAIYFNPKDSPAWKKEYFGASFTLTVYEKEKKSIDTVWLIPYPPDSLSGTAYILEKGRGFRKIDGVTNIWGLRIGYRDYPLVPKIYRPYAVLWFGTKKEEEPFLFLGKINEINRVLDFFNYIWIPQVEEEEKITVLKVGNWRIIILKGLSPGKYVLFYESPYRKGPDYLFEVAQEPEESQQKETSEAKKVTKEAKDPIALLKSENPNAEISVWKEWAIIRYPASESGDMPAQILKWENNQWKIIASY